MPSLRYIRKYIFPSSSNSTKNKCEWIDLIKYVPLRLVEEERKILLLIERTLKVSEYTDNVDIIHTTGGGNRYTTGGGNRMDVIRKEIGNVCATMSGLYHVINGTATTTTTTHHNSSSEFNFFQSCFEIARRYKMINPDRLRDTYIKLMYLLMDSRKNALINNEAEEESDGGEKDVMADKKTVIGNSILYSGKGIPKNLVKENICTVHSFIMSQIHHEQQQEQQQQGNTTTTVSSRDMYMNLLKDKLFDQAVFGTL